MPFHIEKYHFIHGSVLEGLPETETRILKEKTVRREIKKGALIYREGNYPKGVYLLQKGKVKVFQLSADGKEQILFFYSKGDLFGYSPVLCEELYTVSAKALEDCVVSFIPDNVFIRALSKSSVLPNKLLRSMCQEFAVWVNLFASFAQKGVRERVALCLLVLSEKYRKKERTLQPVEVPVSRDDLAAYVGSTRETVVRMLRLFKDEKIIETKGRRILILKPKDLEKISDGT